MNADCTVQDHCAELVEAARAAYAEGRRVGRIEGDEAGYFAGYAAGYADCAHSAGVVMTPAGVRRREAA